jgi:HEAT repeat protein
VTALIATLLGWTACGGMIEPCSLAAMPAAGEAPAARNVAPVDDDDQELLALLTEWLAGKDPDLRTLALEQIRTEVRGAAATQRFAQLLPGLPADVQVGLLTALAERGDREARTAVLQVAADATDESVRLAALRALGDLGTAADVAALVTWLSTDSLDQRTTAMTALTRLQGEGVVAELGRHLQAPLPGPTRVGLVEIAAQRRAVDLVPLLLELKLDEDLELRQASLVAIGQLGKPEHVAPMVAAVIGARSGSQREWAEKAILAIYTRHPELKQQPQHPLLEAFLGLSGDDQAALLPALGRIGGAPVRRVVQWYLNHPYPFVGDVGWRSLCLWPDASVAPELLAAIERPGTESRRAMAFKALVRVAGLADPALDDLQRLEWLKTAMSRATNDQERQLVLKRLSAVRHIESLRFTVSCLDQPSSVEQACQTIVELAHLRWLRDEHKDEFLAALGRVQSLSSDPIVLDRAQRYKEGKTWTGPG